MSHSLIMLWPLLKPGFPRPAALALGRVWAPTTHTQNPRRGGILQAPQVGPPPPCSPAALPAAATLTSAPDPPGSPTPCRTLDLVFPGGSTSATETRLSVSSCPFTGFHSFALWPVSTVDPGLGACSRLPPRSCQPLFWPRVQPRLPSCLPDPPSPRAH